MKYINNFFIKVGYGLGTALIVCADIILIFAANIGFKFLFLYFVFLPFGIDIETIEDIGNLIHKYAYGISAYMLYQEWWESPKTKEPCTFIEVLLDRLNNNSYELDCWYKNHIR